MPLIGYARVSTDDQLTAPQKAELRAAGCTEIHDEHASGGARARPVLARVLDQAGPGDVVLVVRIDRLARSLAHLLEVIEGLEAKGAHFRSLRDPIDTASPQGRFALQVLGAAAELERALIRERTMAGLRAARAEGRVGGNPGLKARDKAAIGRVRRARTERYAEDLARTAQDWVPLVRRHRPHMAWEDLIRLVNARRTAGTKAWTVERLRRAVSRYVADGFLEPQLLGRAPRRSADDRLLAIVAAIKGADPDLTLQQICARLEAMRERTPRGRTKWQPSSVRMLVERAKRLGLLAHPGDPQP